MRSDFSCHHSGTVDFIKRIGQSMGLALWLWVHRPANCSQYPPRSNFEMTMNEASNYHLTEKHCHPSRGDATPAGLLDTLPDSRWLKHFVLDDPEETLPPIARAMKNMFDQNVLIWHADSEDEIVWPHFINQQRTKKDKRFLRQHHDHTYSQSRSKDTKQKTQPTAAGAVQQKIAKPFTDSLGKARKKSSSVSKRTRRKSSSSRAKKKSDSSHLQVSLWERVDLLTWSRSIEEAHTFSIQEEQEALR